MIGPKLPVCTVTYVGNTEHLQEASSADAIRIISRDLDTPLPWITREAWAVVDMIAQEFVFSQKNAHRPPTSHSYMTIGAEAGIEITRYDSPGVPKAVTSVAATIDMVGQDLTKIITTIELKIKPFAMIGRGAGLTTGCLRFPHLLLELTTERSADTAADICVVGPGMDSRGHSPQAVELLSLFPSASMTLLDYDPKALSALTEKFEASRKIPYDPCALNTIPYGRTLAQAPFEYCRLFAQMQKGLTQLSSAKKWNPKWLAPTVEITVNEKQVQVLDFDITSSEFSADCPRFDIIVATLSITNAYTDNPTGIVKSVAKFIRQLKPGGALYVDYPCLMILARQLSTTRSEPVVEKLSSLAECGLSFIYLPIKHYLPTAQKDSGRLASPRNIQSDLDTYHSTGLVHQVSSHTIIGFQRQ